MRMMPQSGMTVVDNPVLAAIVEFVVFVLVVTVEVPPAVEN